MSAAAVVMLASAAPSAAAGEPVTPSPETSTTEAPTTTPTITEEPTDEEPITIPPPTTEAPTTEAPTTTSAPKEPASATPSPAAPPSVPGAQEPVPEQFPLPAVLEASGTDVGGALGLAQHAEVLAVEQVMALESQLARSSAALAAAGAQLRNDEAELADAELRAATTTGQADDAHRTALAAATATLISASTTPHPTTQLALTGTVDADDLWASGLRHAIATPAGERAEHAREVAQAELRRTRTAGAAVEDSRRRLESRTVEVDVTRTDVELARAGRVAAQARADSARRVAVTAFATGGVASDAERLVVLDIPTRTLDGYLAAERRLATERPECRMRWWVVAGIGVIESGHGTSRGAYPAADGVVRPTILGPRLDGARFARINDTDGGRLDGDAEYDRAVGPMQFIPSTWATSGRDGNGDGVADPHNVYDAAYSAADYLCRGARGAPVDSSEGFAAAAWSYNRSRPYGVTTWQRAVGYSAVAPRVVGGLSDSS